MEPLLCPRSTPSTYPAHAQQLGWAETHTPQQEHPQNSSRSCAAGSSRLLGQGGLLAGVPSTHIKSWASEGRAPFGVTCGMWAQLSSSCLTPHSLTWMSVLQQLHQHYALHPSPLPKVVPNTRRQALLTLLTAIPEGLKASAKFPPSAALNR